MTTDSTPNKTTSLPASTGTGYIQTIHIHGEKWNSVQEKSKEKALQEALILCLSTFITIKTCLDPDDQQSAAGISILCHGDTQWLPLVTSDTNRRQDNNLLDLCRELQPILTSNPVKATEAPGSKFYLVIHSDPSDYKIPELNADLVVSISLTDTLQIDWQVSKNMFSEEQFEALVQTHQHLLNWLATQDWEQALPDLLSKDERRLRNQVNQTLTEIRPQPIHQAFFEHALKNPQDIALYWEDAEARRMSYGELADRALKLSYALLDKGAKIGSPVAIVLPKGHSQVLAVMGILGSGALYIPVGVEQPSGRQQKIFRTAGIEFIVTDSATLAHFPHLRELAQELNIFILNLDETTAMVPLDAPVPCSPEQLAYIIFTSGSTGEPKGVEITHQAAWNTIKDVNTKFDVGASDRALALSALDFDLSVYDIFGLLAVGASLVLIREEERKEAATWLHLVEKYKVSLWNSVPALFDMLLLSSSAENDLSSLRLALVSGDWVGLDLRDRMKERAEHCRLIALGGATEASIWSNFFPVDEIGQNWKSIPYGMPLANQKYRVVNDLGLDCPAGVTGELWIGGKGLASGYTGNPLLSASRFVQATGEKWYRTGDLGRYCPDGNLEFLGRIDQQVKLNGFRIELGEIEAALKSYPGLAQATAAVLSIHQSAHLVAGIVAEKIAPANIVDQESTTTDSDSAVQGDYKLQKQVVATFLYQILNLSEYTQMNPADRSDHQSHARPSYGQIEQLKAKLIQEIHIAAEQTAVLDMWLHWLQNEGIITAKAGKLFFHTGLKPIDHADTLMNTFIAQLHERKTLFHQILSNEVPAVSLLDDELLSPEMLNTQDKGTIRGIESIAEKINKAAAASRRRQKIAILGGRTGLLIEKLIQQIKAGQVEYSVIDEGRAMVRSFTQRLCAAGYPVEGIELKHNQLPEQYWYAFDFVVSIGTLHRFPLPDQGLFTSSLLLNNGGRLLALEPEILMPVALLSSGVIDRGFQHFDPQRSETFSPMLNRVSWLSHFQKTGFNELHTENIPGSSSILYQASCLGVHHQLKQSSILNHIQDTLPPHMIPEKLVLLPWMPLSSNGKVDRKAFAELVKIMIEAELQKSPDDFEEPVGETEEGIAELWKELLVLDSVGRNDVFFEIGGDSLSATRFITAVKKRFEVQLSLRELFGVTLKDVAAQVQVQYLKLQQELETMEIGEI